MVDTKTRSAASPCAPSAWKPAVSPILAAQGTAVPFAGGAFAAASALVAAHAGARSTDLLGSPPRGAPV